MAGFSPSACAARPGGICISPGAATSLAKVVLAKAVPEIVYAPCRFGGSRPYFLCPGNNAAGCGAAGCGRRVSKLFLARRYFLCRSCSQVVYAAKYGPQWQRASRQAAKLRQRLDTTGIAVPEKPERMPVHTYARLLEKLLLADTQASEASTARLLRLVAWIEKRRRRNIRFTL